MIRAPNSPRDPNAVSSDCGSISPCYQSPNLAGTDECLNRSVAMSPPFFEFHCQYLTFGSDRGQNTPVQLWIEWDLQCPCITLAQTPTQAAQADFASSPPCRLKPHVGHFALMYLVLIQNRVAKLGWQQVVIQFSASRVGLLRSRRPLKNSNIRS